jgi:hypothetical protein
MAQYKKVYSKFYEMWQIRERVHFGWVVLEEFVTEKKADEFLAKLRGKSA